MLLTVESAIHNITNVPPRPQMPIPSYERGKTTRIVLGIENSIPRITDEGWQLQLGLQAAGYQLWGKEFGQPYRHTDVDFIIKKADPGVILIYDQREWDGTFRNIESMRRSDIFRVAQHKDMQHNPTFHYASHIATMPHAWVVYYHPAICQKFNPWMRPQHVIRTWHTVDSDKIPSWCNERTIPCLFSGATQVNIYPFRYQIQQWIESGALRRVYTLPHPGYMQKGWFTDLFLKILSHTRVALCTASKYAYTLRKFIEATACGCRVIGNPPIDDPFPEIDENMVRVPDDISAEGLQRIIDREVANYDPRRQELLADKAIKWYDYRVVGRRLADRIDEVRNGWHA